jgi:class 3 adenylate cyclase
MKDALDEPRTLLFMAVDILNSTAFKESAEQGGSGHRWLGLFERFFKEFPLVLMGRVALCLDDQVTVPQISLWRVAGDEMVFVARPESDQETLYLFQALHQALTHYHEKLRKEHGLGLKACCWSAGFPQRNISVRIPELASRGDDVEGAYVEYLGPDVDLGFRIAKHAHGGEAMVSLKLAESLAKASDPRGISFRFAGSAVLKGVNAGRPYPLITATFARGEEDPPDDARRAYSTTSGSIRLSPQEVVEMARQLESRGAELR